MGSFSSIAKIGRWVRGQQGATKCRLFGVSLVIARATFQSPGLYRFWNLFTPLRDIFLANSLGTC
jgi:hypothetical protein